MAWLPIFRKPSKLQLPGVMHMQPPQLGMLLETVLQEPVLHRSPVASRVGLFWRLVITKTKVAPFLGDSSIRILSSLGQE
jgi:hypothetical protein